MVDVGPGAGAVGGAGGRCACFSGCPVGWLGT